MPHWYAQEQLSSCVAACLRMVLTGLESEWTEAQVRTLLGQPRLGITFTAAHGKAPASALREQDVKAFLREMVVIGEHLREPLALHYLHGDTVGQAIMLIGTRFIERQRLEKALPRLGYDRDARVRQDGTDEADRTQAKRRIGGAIEGQEFCQHFVRGIQMICCQGRVERPDPRMPLIAGTEERNPVEGIDKETGHAGRFGVPEM